VFFEKQLDLEKIVLFSSYKLYVFKVVLSHGL